MELLEQYNITDIIEIIILFSLAVKGFISFIEWGIPRIRRVVKKADQPEQIKNDFRKHIEQFEDLKKCIGEIMLKIDTLIKSDKDDIKAFITRQHHYFVYQKGWIDDYSLDCIQRRYEHYVAEGGNSFIEGLMGEIRKLPKKAQNAQKGKIEK